MDAIQNKFTLSEMLSLTINGLRKTSLSFTILLVILFSSLALPITLGAQTATTQNTANSIQSPDDFYITDGIRPAFRSDFQKLIISQSILEDPVIELQTREIQAAEASLRVYRADKSTLLDFLTHDANIKPINELDLSKLGLVENLTVNIENNPNQTFSSSGKIKLNTQAVGIYVIWAKFKSKIQTTILIRSNFGTVTTKNSQNLIFWTQNLSTNKSAQSGTVTTYNLLRVASALENNLINNQGITTIPKNPRTEIALVDIDGDVSLIPINRFSSSRFYNLIETEPKYNHFYSVTDRAIYFPGQTINFKAFYRSEKDLVWTTPTGKITARPVCDSCVGGALKGFTSKELTLSSSGTVSGEFKIPDDIETGSYYLDLNTQASAEDIELGQISWFNIINYKNPGNLKDPTSSQEAQRINENSSKISLKLDKEKYQVGDEATLTITSQSSNQDFFMTTGKSLVNDYKIVSQTPVETQVKILVKESDLPKLTVNISSFIGDKLEYSNILLNIDTISREIQTTITADKENYNPGDTVNLEITTQSAGEPISAEVSLNVIDQILFKATKSSKTLSTAFYGDTAINSNGSNSLLPIYFTELDGRDFNVGETINTPDKNQYAFSPFNFWNPNLKTDSNGKATISFKLPETFATWVIDVTSISDQDRPIASQTQIEISTNNSAPLSSTVTNVPLPTTEINVSDKSPLNTINPSTQITKLDNNIEALSTASNNQTVELITKSALILALVILSFGFAILVLILILTIRKPHINNIKDLVKDLRYEFEKYHALTSQSIANGNFNPFKSLLSHQEVTKLVAKEPSAVVIHPEEADVRHLPEKSENETTDVVEKAEPKPTLAQIKQSKSTVNKTKTDNKVSKSKPVKNSKTKKATEKSLKEIKEDLKKSKQ